MTFATCGQGCLATWARRLLRRMMLILVRYRYTHVLLRSVSTYQCTAACCADCIDRNDCVCWVKEGPQCRLYSDCSQEIEIPVFALYYGMYITSPSPAKTNPSPSPARPPPSPSPRPLPKPSPSPKQVPPPPKPTPSPGATRCCMCCVATWHHLDDRWQRVCISHHHAASAQRLFVHASSQDTAGADGGACVQ